MRGALLDALKVGCIALILIPLVSRFIPFVGLFAWVLTLGVWIWLPSRFVQKARDDLATNPNPRIPAMGYGALIGAVTGFVGALFALILNMIFFSSLASSAGTPDAQAVAGIVGLGSAVWGMVALVTRPLWGAVVAGLFGLIWGGSVRPQAASE